MDPAYFLHVTQGELRSLTRSRPISRLLSTGELTSDQAHKLELVQRVRIYARDCVGLNVGCAYTYFEDNAGGPIAYAVSGSRKDRLEPYEWTYPIIGVYEAKGFFDRGLAAHEAERLKHQDYDVAVSEVSGFSTMGILPDPIRASNLQSDDIDLAILVFHELMHNTIFKPSDTQFNESMATFVGRTAAELYFRDTFGRNSAEAAESARRLADLKIIDTYVADLYQQLDVLYRQLIPAKEKIARRKAIFDTQRERYRQDYEPRLGEPQRYATMIDVATDNAGVLIAYRYHSNLDLYAETHSRLGNDLHATITFLRKAARCRDSQRFIRNGLNGYHNVSISRVSFWNRPANSVFNSLIASGTMLPYVFLISTPCG